MQVHDNYLKPLTGFYLNSASVSAGKTLDKNMHEDDLYAIADILNKLQYDLEYRLFQASGEASQNFQPSKTVSPIAYPGSMAGLEKDLHENQLQVLLSDE